ncbi:MAG TPA: hypothetical protein DCM08_07965, partial [Microscillaceae bacterium]|nr:hypothetical protein [Microscillaceae bacterium]
MSAQNFLQDYVRKILEIQQQRERSSISEQEMKQIAEDMGIDYGQIEEVKLAYWMRGEGHLRNHNFEDALDEFEQLLILSPNDPNVFYNIASCYAGTWFAKGKKAAREEALKFAEACIDIDPAHEKAFKLIGELKGTKKATAGTAYKPTQQPNNKIAVKIVVAVLIFSFLSSLIPVFISIFKSSKSLTNSFQQLRGTLQSETINLGSVRGGVASIGSKGSVLWVVSQASSGSKFQALVISLNEKKQIATIDLPAFEGTSFSQPMAMAGAIYFFDQKQGIFEARDMYTGEIVENNKILANRYEPLKAG